MTLQIFDKRSWFNSVGGGNKMKEIDNAIAANRGAKCSHADLPKVKFDQPVIFNGDGVVVEDLLKGALQQLVDP